MANVTICPYCDDQIEDSESHTKGSSKEDETFSCNNCDLAVSNKKCITIHEKIVHDETKKVFSCESCNIDFSSKMHLFAHKNHDQIHSNNFVENVLTTIENFDIKMEITESEDFESEKLKPKAVEKPYKCDQCSKTFNYRRSLREHSNWHKGILIDCKKCPKKFKYSSNLVSHMKNFHSKLDLSQTKVTCSVCKKEYKNDIALKSHFKLTRNFSRLRRLTFLFKGNMSPYYFKTIFTLCMKCMPSFIKIGGAVSEKNDHIRQTFVVLFIGCFIFMFHVYVQIYCKLFQMC